MTEFENAVNELRKTCMLNNLPMNAELEVIENTIQNYKDAIVELRNLQPNKLHEEEWNYYIDDTEVSASTYKILEEIYG